VNYSSASVIVTSAAGPFLVTAPNTAVSWNGDSTQTVTWNVASTTAAPVACANVKILLSTDGGTTFPTTVLASTPNDGTQTVTVPNVATTTARMRVECATAPFFDISNANFTIIAVVPAPTNVVATAITTTSVGVTWTAAAGAVSYEVYRRAPGGSFTLLGPSVTTGYTDLTASAATAYLYAVKSIDALAAASALSTPDLATTVLFTDPSLTPSSTTARALHVSELRTAIGAVRTLAVLGAFSYTDPTLTAAVTKIKAAHLTEARTALEAARTALGLTAITYTDPAPVAFTTLIKAVHVQELRNGVQ
jgi:hypothetical protein